MRRLLKDFYSLFGTAHCARLPLKVPMLVRSERVDQGVRKFLDDSPRVGRHPIGQQARGRGRRLKPILAVAAPLLSIGLPTYWGHCGSLILAATKVCISCCNETSYSYLTLQCLLVNFLYLRLDCDTKQGEWKS